MFQFRHHHFLCLILWIAAYLPTSTQAAQVLSITPITTLQAIAVGLPTTFKYNITNISGAPVNNISFGLPSVAVLNQSQTTCGRNLAIGQSCVLAMTVTATSAGPLSLPVDVFSFSGALCSRTNAANTINLMVTAAPFVVIAPDPVPANQHFAAKAITITPVGFDADIENIAVSPNLSGKIKLCGKLSSSEPFYLFSTVAPARNPDYCGINSECVAGDTLTANSTCRVWVRAIDNSTAQGNTSGTITVQTSGGVRVINVSYDRDLYAAGNTALGLPGGLIGVIKLVGENWVQVGANAAAVFNAVVQHMIVDPTGDLVVSGRFGNGGIARVARLLGTTWTTVGSNDAFLIAGGASDQINILIVDINANLLAGGGKLGKLDTTRTWVPIGTNDAVVIGASDASDFVLEPSGALVMFGDFTGGGLTRTGRLTAGTWVTTGTNDAATFNGTPENSIIDSTGTLIVGGTFAGGATTAGIAKLVAGTWVDVTTNDSDVTFGSGMAIDLNGQVILSGFITGGVLSNVARLSGNWINVGTNDAAAFMTSPGAPENNVVLNGNGNIVIVGLADFTNGPGPFVSVELINGVWTQIATGNGSTAINGINHATMLASVNLS